MNYYNGPNQPYYPSPYGAPPPNPWNGPIRRNANIVCSGLILMILLGLFAVPFLTRISDYFIFRFGIHSPQMLSLTDMTVELITTCLMFIVPILVMKLFIGIPADAAFPMRRPRAVIAVPSVFICLGASVGGFIIYGVITAFFESVFGIAPYLPPTPNPLGIPAAIVYFLRLTVAPAVLEELMFRGVIMQSLRRFGDWFALVCSSILFSLAHHNLVQGPNAMLLGMVIGFFVLRTGSLRTGMLIHFVNNTAAVFVDFLMKEMPARETGMMTLLVFAFYVISGLICLAFLMFTQSGMFSLAPSRYPVEEKKKYSLFFLGVAPLIYTAAVIVFTCMQFR